MAEDALASGSPARNPIVPEAAEIVELYRTSLVSAGPLRHRGLIGNNNETKGGVRPRGTRAASASISSTCARATNRSSGRWTRPPTWVRVRGAVAAPGARAAQPAVVISTRSRYCTLHTRSGRRRQWNGSNLGLPSTARCAVPDVSGNYLRQACSFDDQCGAPTSVVTGRRVRSPGDGERPENHTLMRYALAEATAIAEPSWRDRRAGDPRRVTDTPKRSTHIRAGGEPRPRDQLRHLERVP